MQKMQKMDAKSYPYIVAWGRYLGSFDYYIALQIELANEDGAPADAIYKKDDGTWATFGGIKDDYTKRQVEARLKH